MSFYFRCTVNFYFRRELFFFCRELFFFALALNLCATVADRVIRKNAISSLLWTPKHETKKVKWIKFIYGHLCNAFCVVLSDLIGF